MRSDNNEITNIESEASPPLCQLSRKDYTHARTHTQNIGSFNSVVILSSCIVSYFRVMDTYYIVNDSENHKTYEATDRYSRIPLHCVRMILNKNEFCV